MSSTQDLHDVIVIGSGLSGLTAALRLQGAGHSVLVLEKRDLPGGLCGTKCVDGYEFVTACNDFGLGLGRILYGLGVRVAFRTPRTRFFFDDAVQEIPASPLALAHLLLPRIPDAVRFLWALRKGHETHLGPCLRRHVRDRHLADVIASLAYPLGISPDDLPVAELTAQLSREYAYGYHRPIVPVGGPAALVRRMVERLEEQGGKLVLEAECIRTVRDGKIRAVLTADGRHFRARHVVSSQGRPTPRSGDTKPGLALSMLLVAVRKDLAFPDAVHTLVHFPSGISSWLAQIDAGELPEEFGFHLFRSDLPERPDHYTLNLCCFLPRGEDDPSPARIHAVEDYVLGRVERMIPRLGSALLYKRFVSPKAFRALHGLSSRVAAFVPRAGVRKPEPFDHEREIYYVGNAVDPPGEHAGQAVLSGLRGAEALAQAMARSH